MACSICGNTDSTRVKHLPMPDGGNGWITLTNWTEYCVKCVQEESNKFTKIIEAAKESVKNG